MARQFETKTNDITVVDFLDDEAEVRPQTEAEAKTQSIQDALNEDPEAFLNVSRQIGSGKTSMEVVGRFPADKDDYGQLQAHLQENFGAGDYRIMLYVKGRVRANKLLTIAQPLKPANVSTQQDNVTMLILNQLEKMQNQIVSIMQEKQTGGNSRMEFMQELMMMKQIFSSDNKPSSGIKDIVDTIGSLKELGLNIGGVIEPEEKGFGDLLALAAPVLQNITAPQAAPAYQPNPIAQKPQLTPEQKEAQKMNMMLRLGIGQLIAGAKRNSPHDTYATLVIDNIPEAQIMAFFNSPTGFADLVKIAPEVANHSAWFGELAEHIKAQLGLPSRVSDLYDDADSDSVAETDSETGNSGTN